MVEELRTLKGSLEERIGEERAAIHRDALQAFLADDAVDKAAYDAALEKALGDDHIARAMHNALLLATLRHALADAGSEMDVDETHAPADAAVAPSHNPPLQTTAAAAAAAPAAAAPGASNPLAEDQARLGDWWVRCGGDEQRRRRSGSCPHRRRSGGSEPASRPQRQGATDRDVPRRRSCR